MPICKSGSHNAFIPLRRFWPLNSTTFTKVYLNTLLIDVTDLLLCIGPMEKDQFDSLLGSGVFNSDGKHYTSASSVMSTLILVSYR
jgi:hypothetical protein